MSDKKLNRCSLADEISPSTCEHQFGKGQIPFTLCKSDLPCTFRKLSEVAVYDKCGADANVTNIKTEEEKTA